MEENNPYTSHKKLYDSIEEWFKDPRIAPNNQARYKFTEAKTYYQQLVEINKFLTYFKGVLTTIFANEKEIKDAWDKFVMSGVSATAKSGEIGVNVTGTIKDGLVFNFTIPSGAPSTSTPLMDGIASIGSEQAYSRGDHRHPTDTTRASQTDLDSLDARVESAEDTIDSHTQEIHSAKARLDVDEGNITTLFNNKQDKLTAGTNITIVGSTINSTGNEDVNLSIIDGLLNITYDEEV